MAKNATMKDGRPEGSDKEGGRAPTATEERVAAYNDYKSTTAENVARFTAPDGSIADPLGLALAQGQAFSRLGSRHRPGDLLDIYGRGRQPNTGLLVDSQMLRHPTQVTVL